ncbi:MAG TPA: hypothetical protein PKK91_05285 [bacterium]|jgi:hypothetical protein|nr:hypothetical protein [bacterium]HOO14548.1 hypothetical protein [Candidatus Neomarinimicrobiota bacterium]HRV05100.1 hypothetical protein [Candidatus Ratteibacteria bacterium]
MKKTLSLLTVLALVGFVCVPVFADDTDDQSVTCTVNGLLDAINAPEDVTLECARKASVESISAGTCTYGSDAASRKVTVSAAGTGVAGATLSIKGGDLEAYTPLITGSTPAEAVTLKSELAAADPGTAVASDIYLQLDASGVLAGATGLGEAKVYTLTYTLTQ